MSHQDRHDEIAGTAPRIDGSLDAEYLTAALRRGGRAGTPEGKLELSELTDGRTGARISAIGLGTGAAGYVLKRVARERGISLGLGNPGEGAFWLAGTTRDLPQAIINPAIDVALHEGSDEWWILMDDLSHGIVPRGGWSERHTERLFQALAQYHAAHWDAGSFHYGTLEGTTRLLAETMVYVATGEQEAPEPWVPRVADEFPVPRWLLPAFLETLGERDAECFIALGRQWRDIVAALQKHPATLLHGDTRRANIAFLPEQVGLFDWELAGSGPAAVDLAWHWFLHFWAYPPDDGKAPDERLWLREAYLSALEARLGRSVDRRAFGAAWELGWLRVFVQLGFLLADPLVSGSPSAEEVDRVRELCRRAITAARRICDTHVA